MKFFLDTANLEDIQQWSYLLDGVTTNPSLLSKEAHDPKQQVLKICKILPGYDVSVEITEQEPQAVYNQAKKIAALNASIVVKIPCHVSYYPIIHKLVNENVRLNITLVFTLIQALFMCKLGVVYISPFIGRWDDIDVDGIELLYQLRSMIDQYGYSTQILAASLRHVRHMHEAIMAGVDVATVPVDVLKKALEHPLTNNGMALFDKDWKKLGIKNFPE